MKQIKEIKSEIKRIEEKYSNQSQFEKRELKRAGKKKSLLISCVQYLETDPSEAVIKAQLLSVMHKIELINAGYSNWFTVTAGASKSKNPLTMYRAELGVPLLKHQVSVMKYLLN